MSSVISRATALYQAKNYSGSGDWLDESGNGYDFTINGATHNGDHFSLDGIDDYFSRADTADLDIATGEDATVMAVIRMSSSPTGSDGVFVKGLSTAAAPAWWFYLPSALTPRFRLISSSGAFANDVGPAFSTGDIVVIAGRKRVSDLELEAFTDGVGSGSPDSFTDADTSNTEEPTGGAFSNGTLELPADVFALAFWKEALTDAEIVQAGNELTSPSNLLLLGVG